MGFACRCFITTGPVPQGYRQATRREISITTIQRLISVISRLVDQRGVCRRSGPTPPTELSTIHTSALCIGHCTRPRGILTTCRPECHQSSSFDPGLGGWMGGCAFLLKARTSPKIENKKKRKNESGATRDFIYPQNL